MEKIAIVVVAYNRVESLKRLLYSLNCAHYSNQHISLIISIDNSGENMVQDYVKGFHWLHGEKIIKTYHERLGLRKHILKCGSYVTDYDAIVVLEDDLVVAPAFWNYVCHAVNTYQDNYQIAGISLYSVEWNTNINYPFIAQQGKYDVYFMQRAQSWGQVWMKKSWNAFMNWYETHGEDKEWDLVPDQISSWPESSWLKYHMKYCMENKKYFVYPYVGLTTCFCEEGTHYKSNTSIMQVSMMLDVNKIYNFPDQLEEQGVIIYDKFFERVGLAGYMGKNEDELDVDIYGDSLRKFNKGYILSSQILNYKILESFGLQMRPQEINIKFQVTGSDIFLYDKNTLQKNPKMYHSKQIKYEYYHKLKGKSAMLLKVFIYRIFKEIRMIFSHV